MDEKKPWTKPEIVIYGTVEDITQQCWKENNTGKWPHKTHVLKGCGIGDTVNQDIGS